MSPSWHVTVLSQDPEPVSRVSLEVSARGHVPLTMVGLNRQPLSPPRSGPEGSSPLVRQRTFLMTSPHPEAVLGPPLRSTH